MPILMMALLALAVFVGLFFLFVGAMEAEHHQRDAEERQPQKVKAAAQGSGRN
ncbi:MAG TPA: hypothetical protein VD837_16950 [Terriglobales bacterium]|nr:hypothetical protein [Terriglobales bacterium]